MGKSLEKQKIKWGKDSPVSGSGGWFCIEVSFFAMAPDSLLMFQSAWRKKDGFERSRYFVTSHGVKNAVVAICSHLQFRFTVT